MRHGRNPDPSPQNRKERGIAHVTFQAFKARALVRSFHEVLERKWGLGAIVAAHTHPFDADALVVLGDMRLTVGDVDQHLRPGETFALDANVVLSERYGTEGAADWVARRNAPGSAEE